jgi:PAS domain S-box-containing protein
MTDGDPPRRPDATRLALLLEASNDGFWDWDVQTGEVFFGGRWGAMLGYSPDELEPHVRTWERLVHPDDLPWVSEVLRAHLEGRTDHYQAEHRLLAKDGSWRWILDRGRVVERDADGRPLRACGAHVDVTERKLVELEKERIARDREQLIGMVSHELKNPMQLILSSVDALERSAGRPDFARLAARSVVHVRRALARMNRLVADLLDTTRLEGGRLPLRKARVSLRDTVAGVVQLQADAARARGVAIELSPRGDAEVDADPERVAQLLANVVDNAVKFSPQGARVEVSVEPGAGEVRVRVRDHGPGIAPEDRERVFERFWQHGSRAYEGVGLGLYIARGIAEAHGGRLFADAAPGGGSVFTLALPRP